MTINWDAIGALAELVGAIAVLASLIYLAKQVQNNTREVRAENIHKIADSFNEINLLLFENDEVAELWLKGINEYASLTPKEKLRYDFGWLAAFRIYDSMYYQTKTGTGDTESFQAELATIEWFFSHQGAREWWGSQKFGLSPGFRDYVDRIVAKSEGNAS